MRISDVSPSPEQRHLFFPSPAGGAARLFFFSAISLPSSEADDTRPLFSADPPAVLFPPSSGAVFFLLSSSYHLFTVELSVSMLAGTLVSHDQEILLFSLRRAFFVPWALILFRTQEPFFR